MQPLSRIRLWILLLLIIWMAGRYFFGQKHWWWLANCAMLGIAIYGIMHFTVLHRGTANQEEAIFIPFYSFIEAKIQPEKYREMLMNVFLFVPFGLSLPNVMDAAKRIKNPVPATMLTAFALSVGIELCQYYFRLGRCEVDDVIMNSLGALIGMVSYLAANSLRSGTEKKDK